MLTRLLPRLHPQEAVEDACGRTMRRLQQAGLSVDRLDDLTIRLALWSFARLLRVLEARHAHLIFVCPGEWTTERCQVLLSAWRALASGPGSRRWRPHLLSAHRAPGMLGYLIGAGPRSRLALDAWARIQEGSFLSPGTAPQHAQIALDLLHQHLGGQWSSRRRETLADLDALVLERLRPQAGPGGGPQGYAPASLLIGLGCLAGEIVRAQPRLVGDWERWSGLGVGYGVALRVRSAAPGREGSAPHPGATVTVNPIGRAFRLFAQGAGHELAGLYAGLCDLLGGAWPERPPALANGRPPADR